MRRPLLATLTLALAACACGRCTPPAPAAADAGAARAPDAGSGLALEALTGDVRLQRASAPGAPALEGPLRDGDTLQTGAGAAATVRLPDGRRLEVGPEARLRVSAGAGHIELEVLQGEVLSRTPAAPARARVLLTLRTPQGLTRVSAGSEVQVAVEGAGAVKVTVRLGEVEFIGPTGERTRGVQGDVLRVTAGRVEVVARERRVLALAPLRVTVRADGPGTQLRKGGAGAWRALAARGEVLAPGDGLRARGSPARLSLQGSGSALLLQRGGELAFDGAGQAEAPAGAPDGALDEARVQLRRGALALQVAPGRSGRLVLPELTVESGGGGLQLERGQGPAHRGRAHGRGHAGARRGAPGPARRGARAGARGRWAAARGGPAARGGGAAGGRRRGRRAAAALPPGPLRGGAGVGRPGAPRGGAAWRSRATRPSRTRCSPGRCTRPSSTCPRPRAAQLHWRVTDAQGARVAQGVVRLAPEPPRRALAQLRNEVPEGTERTTIFYRTQPPGVTFTWAPCRTPRVPAHRVPSRGAGQSRW